MQLRVEHACEEHGGLLPSLLRFIGGRVTIVAEPYKAVELIDIYIYYNNRKKLEIFLLTSWFMGGQRDERAEG